MVSRSYLEKKPSPPQGLHAWIDRDALPAAANRAFAVELWVDGLAETVRQNPLASLAAAVGATLLVGRLFAPRRRAAYRNGTLRKLRS